MEGESEGSSQDFWELLFPEQLTRWTFRLGQTPEQKLRSGAGKGARDVGESLRCVDIDRKRERPEDVTQRQYCSVWGGAAGDVEGGALKLYP